MSKKSWFKFCPNDWLSDIELRDCSLEAKGLLIELMAIAHPTGYIPTDPQKLHKVCRVLRVYPQKFKRILQDLLKCSRVLLTESSEFYYIPRMVADHDKYLQAKEFGHQGGNPNLRKPLNPPVKTPFKPEEEREYKKKKRVNPPAVNTSPGNLFSNSFKPQDQANRPQDWRDKKHPQETEADKKPVDRDKMLADCQALKAKLKPAPEEDPPEMTNQEIKAKLQAGAKTKAAADQDTIDLALSNNNYNKEEELSALSPDHPDYIPF